MATLWLKLVRVYLSVSESVLGLGCSLSKECSVCGI